MSRAKAANARLVSLLQLTLAGYGLLGSLVVLVFGEYQLPPAVVGGALALFLAATAALTIPWSRFPPSAPIVLAAVDVVAIAALQVGAPRSGFFLLWAFPTMWAAWALGLRGGGVVVLAVTALATIAALLEPGPQEDLSLAVFPMFLVGLVIITGQVARRASAQRELLERQSVALRLAAEQARSNEELVTGTLNAVDFGVTRISAAGITDLSNRAEADLQKVRARTAEATYGADGLTPLAAADRPLARALRGETFEGELAWYGSPGDDRRALRTSARRLADGRGQGAATIVVTQDVTAEQLALRAREDLMASVSHELRTPLTSILGYLELALEDEGLRPSVRRGLEVALRGAERMLLLIGDILDTAGSERSGGSLKITPERVDLSELVRAASEAARPRADQRQMVLDESGAEPATAWADPNRVRQILDNLVSNAINYSTPGTPIEIGCTTNGGHAWLAVRDHGPGISAAEAPRVFDRYFRGDSVRNTSTHGSGLGLAISRAIARAHGGDLTLQTSPGQGCTFLLRLPAAEPDGAPR